MSTEKYQWGSDQKDPLKEKTKSGNAPMWALYCPTCRGGLDADITCRSCGRNWKPWFEPGLRSIIRKIKAWWIT